MINNILTRGFWGDEAWTVLISKLPWFDLAKTTAADFHPPLYYTIVHFWMQIFGSGEVAVRLVSLIFWLLAGITIYFFARALRLSTFYCLLSSLFILFNPFIFPFAFEARNYTLFVFLSLASMWLFYTKNNFYILPTVLGLYTHYYMFFVVAAQYLFILFFRRELFKKFLTLGIIMGVLYLPWIPFFFSQVRSVAGGYWIAKPGWDTIAGAVIVLITGEQRTIFTYVLPFVFLIHLFFAGRSKKFLTAESALLALWVLVPFLISIAISLVRSIFFYRYLVFTAVPLMLVPLYWSNGRKKISFLSITILGIYVFTAIMAVFSQTDQHFKPILSKIHQGAQPGDAIFTVLPSFAEVVYYNNGKLPVRILSVGLSQASGKALLDTYVAKGYVTIADLPKTGRYWFLEPGPKYALVNSNSY